MAGTLRLRIFAGPNGSGKSTIINAVRSERVNGRPIDLGYYLNADDIGRELKSTGRYDLGRFRIKPKRTEFQEFAIRSGLIRKGFTRVHFRYGHLRGSMFRLRRPKLAEHFAQLLTAYLCEQLIIERRKFSFETVFSHSSKLELMRRANAAGYKVYLYFVSTESPEINIERVAIRVKQGGHDVPAVAIRKRYEGAMQQLYPAMELAYRTYFFDNSDSRPLGEIPSEPYFSSLRFRPSPLAVEWHHTSRPKPEWFEHYVGDKLGAGLIVTADVTNLSAMPGQARHDKP